MTVQQAASAIVDSDRVRTQRERPYTFSYRGSSLRAHVTLTRILGVSQTSKTIGTSCAFEHFYLEAIRNEYRRAISAANRARARMRRKSSIKNLISRCAQYTRTLRGLPLVAGPDE